MGEAKKQRRREPSPSGNGQVIWNIDLPEGFEPPF